MVTGALSLKTRKDMGDQPAAPGVEHRDLVGAELGEPQPVLRIDAAAPRARERRRRRIKSERVSFGVDLADATVAKLEDVDRMWELFTAHQGAPFRLMDKVGLDVVLAIEEHYAAVRKDVPEGPRKLLRRYVEGGRLGVKSGRGFYEDYSKGD